MNPLIYIQCVLWVLLIVFTGGCSSARLLGPCGGARLRVRRPCWRCAAAGRSPMTGIRLASAPRRCSFRDVCHRFTQYRRDVLAAEPVRHQLWLPDHRLLQAGGWQQ